MVQTLPSNPGFDVEREDNVVPHPKAATPSIAAEALTIALRALSQRALIALASLFSILLAASVFALYWKVLPNPSVESLTGLGLYSVFIIGLHVVRARK
jgi:hypothetical protein